MVPSSLRDTLHRALCSVLAGVPETQVEDIAADPLVLVAVTDRDVTAFAAMDGKPDDEFASADKQFKTLYERRRSEWGRKEPILVMLKTAPGRVFDERYSVIERNPYFCRKFVLDASAPERLDHELRRLPFVPLEMATVDQRRPVAVQTLLRKLDVHKELAKFLAKPHERHETGIVDDCLAGRFGRPTAVPKDVPGLSSEIRADRVPTRITHIEVSGFRAYRRPQTFDLDADIVVLHGPNGLGKTSLFDAIEFLCTGSVERIDRRAGSRSQRTERALANLESPAESWVSGDFNVGGKRPSFKRCVSGSSIASTDAGPRDRKQVLLELAGLLDEDSRPDIRVDNLIALFRATHFFGQEFQSLLADLKSRCELPTEVVSRMLAYEDYVEATAKAEKVRAEITSRLDDVDRRAKELNVSIAARQQGLATLVAAASRDQLPEARLEEALRASARMVTEATRAGISVLAGAEDNQARGWRLLLEGELKVVSSAIEAVRSMAPKVSELQTQLREQSERDARLGLLHARSQSLAQEHAAKTALAQAKQANLVAMQTRLASQTTRRDNLAWLVRAKLEADERQTACLRADTERKRVEAQLVQGRLGVATLTAERDSALKSAASLEGSAYALEQRLKALSEVERLLVQWEKAATQRQELAAQKSSIEAALKGARQRESAAGAEIAALAPVLRTAERAVSELEQARTAYEKLLDAALDHVKGDSCPVCGKEYSSQQELTERIRRLRGTLTPELESARNEVAQIRTRHKALENIRNKAQAEVASLLQRQTTGASQAAEVEKSIKTFEAQAVAAGLPKELLEVRTALPPAIRAASASVAETRRQLTVQQGTATEMKKQVVRASKEVEELEARLGPISEEMKAIREHLGRVRGEASNRHVSLDRDADAVGKELQGLNGELASLESAVGSSSAALEEAEREAAVVKEASAEVASEYKEVSAHRSRVDQSVRAIEDGFSRLKLHPTEEGVSARLSELVARRSNLEALKEQVLALEAALDARATSAAQALALREVEILQREAQEVRTRAAELRTWRTYFDNVLDRLRCVRGESLDQYIRYYEPLASMIQRRLRPVYGFGEMRLRQSKGSIVVSVEKEGHDLLEPNLYYSESQLQVAALSLFLSASLTQPWSSFAPILMDDPVTHFDDLNAYAYLDLVIGLAADRRRRQFVLSTCEERLYRLMRRRLANMNVIFYEFNSIGEAGPRVERVGETAKRYGTQRSSTET